MKLKEAVRVVVFVAICLAIVVVLGRELIPDYSVTMSDDEQFYSAPENSVDVMFFGGSGILRGTSPLTLYRDKKITAQTRGSVLQAPHITYLEVKEALKTQKPKVVFISTLYLFDQYSMDGGEAKLRMALDRKKLSMDKIEAVRETVKYSEKQDLISYMLPLLRYHDRWKEPYWKEEDKSKVYKYAKGQVYMLVKRPQTSLIGNADPEGQIPATVDPHSKRFYQKAIKQCKSKGVKVVLLIMPRDRWDGGKHLAVKQFADENRVDYLDMNQDNHLINSGLDFERDFYDSTHSNAFGSVKITKYLGDYLEEHYGLGPSRVSQSVTDQYERSFRRFEAILKDRRPEWDFDKI